MTPAEIVRKVRRPSELVFAENVLRTVRMRGQKVSDELHAAITLNQQTPEVGRSVVERRIGELDKERTALGQELKAALASTSAERAPYVDLVNRALQPRRAEICHRMFVAMGELRQAAKDLHDCNSAARGCGASPLPVPNLGVLIDTEKLLKRVYLRRPEKNE
jgi:hypothetical protein